MESNVILHMCNTKKYVMVVLNRKQGVACDKNNNTTTDDAGTSPEVKYLTHKVKAKLQ